MWNLHVALSEVAIDLQEVAALPEDEVVLKAMPPRTETMCIAKQCSVSWWEPPTSHFRPP